MDCGWFILKFFVFTACMLLVSGQGLRFETLSRNRCPEGFSCEIVSACTYFWNLYREGKDPQICGWSNEIPLVCCPFNTAGEQPHIGGKPEDLVPNFGNERPCRNEESPYSGDKPEDETPHLAVETPEDGTPHLAVERPEIGTPHLAVERPEDGTPHLAVEMPDRNEEPTNNDGEPVTVASGIEGIKFHLVGEDPFYFEGGKHQPNTERKPMKISPISSGGCGFRQKDISSNVPKSAFRKGELNMPPTSKQSSEEGSVRTAVVGGKTANHEWAWMAGIFKRKGSRPFCGGTVIDDRHVITAAHCFDHRNVDANLYVVKIGEIDLRSSNMTYEIEEIKLHESYQFAYYYNDIAIIRLKKNLPYDVIPVCLPDEDMLMEGDNVMVLGWGDLSYGGISSHTLQEGEGLPVIGNEKCNDKFERLPGNQFPIGITNDMICAGLEEGGVDACQGDSGGPLLREYSENHWALVGVVSFGFRCAEPGYPGVYTRVSAFLPWIKKYVDDKSAKYAPRPIFVKLNRTIDHDMFKELLKVKPKEGV